MRIRTPWSAELCFSAELCNSLSPRAITEMRLPDFISAHGFGITEAARRYLAPLIVGEAYQPFQGWATLLCEAAERRSAEETDYGIRRLTTSPVTSTTSQRDPTALLPGPLNANRCLRACGDDKRYGVPHTLQRFLIAFYLFSVTAQKALSYLR